MTTDTSRGSRAGAPMDVVAAMVIWGSAFVVTKATAEQFQPLTLAFLRFAVASLVLVPIMPMRRG